MKTILIIITAALASCLSREECKYYEGEHELILFYPNGQTDTIIENFKHYQLGKGCLYGFSGTVRGTTVACNIVRYEVREK